MLVYYWKLGISYILAGENDIDINTSLNKLYDLFDIKVLLLEGVSIISDAFERENLIDELSLVVAPIVAGENSKPLFEKSAMQEFFLLDAKIQFNGAIWLRYRR